MHSSIQLTTTIQSAQPSLRRSPWLTHSLIATACLLGSLLFHGTVGASVGRAVSASDLIAFITDAGLLYTINPDGTGKKLVGPGYDPDWSPEGTQFAFANPVGDFEIGVMNADGSGVYNLTNNNVRDTFPAWSPDGSQIAFYSDRGPIGVWLMNSDGSNQHFLSDGVLPNWSPDGSKIIFQTSRDGNSEVYTMNPDGSGLTNLTNNPVEDDQPCYSPNGSTISFISDRDGNGEIYLMDPDGNNQMRLTHTPEDEGESSWSSDGTQIAFASLRPPAGIYIMNSDGTDQTFVPNQRWWREAGLAALRRRHNLPRCDPCGQPHHVLAPWRNFRDDCLRRISEPAGRKLHP
jgi:dipeptidyl aminopeptidase/acylaminoacyl peptidase